MPAKAGAGEDEDLKTAEWHWLGPGHGVEIALWGEPARAGARVTPVAYEKGRKVVLRRIPDGPGAVREAEAVCARLNAGGAVRDRMVREAGL